MTIAIFTTFSLDRPATEKAVFSPVVSQPLRCRDLFASPHTKGNSLLGQDCDGYLPRYCRFHSGFSVSRCAQIDNNFSSPSCPIPLPPSIPLLGGEDSAFSEASSLLNVPGLQPRAAGQPDSILADNAPTIQETARMLLIPTSQQKWQ